MYINSINNTFGATLSGDFLKIMTRSLVNGAKDIDVTKAFHEIRKIIPDNAFDIWISKPTKQINFVTKLPQNEAIVIVSKEHIHKGIKFIPDEMNPNLLEQYAIAIKKLAKQDFSKQYKVLDDSIEWIA